MSTTSSSTDFSILEESGLNLQAVLAWDGLSVEVRGMLSTQASDSSRYRRLLLLGHGGQRLWQALQASSFRDRPEPVDSFSVDVVQRWLVEVCPDAAYEIIYPAPERLVPLQQLGKLAGWHHDSPFLLGINKKWGSWFAYRVVVIVDSDWPTTITEPSDSPCEECADKPCLAACPANALTTSTELLRRCTEYSSLGGGLDPLPPPNTELLRRCTEYRLTDDSRCVGLCLSRLACPVAAEHRYTPKQLHYHYEHSLQTIRRWLQGGESVQSDVSPRSA